MLDDPFIGSLLPDGGCWQSFVVLPLPLFSILILWPVMLPVRPNLLLIRQALVLAVYWYPGQLLSLGSYLSV